MDGRISGARVVSSRADNSWGACGPCGGESHTKRVILEIYDEMAEAMKTGKPYQTRLDPPPGQPRPADWPRHIHAPREVYDWAKKQGIDWRTLLEPAERGQNPDNGVERLL